MGLHDIIEQLRSVGLSSFEQPMLQITDEPKLPAYLCLPNEKAKKQYDTAEAQGQGSSRDDLTARVKAVGEFLERLCLYNLDEKKLERRPTTLFFSRDAAIGLFCCYSSEQGDARAFVEEAEYKLYRWIRVKDLAAKTRLWIPAQMVYLAALFDDEFQIRGERISTGAALGIRGTNTALENGFLEVVERDGCITAYLSKRASPRIEGLPDHLQRLVEYFRRYQLEPYVFDVATGLGIPTVLAVTVDRSGLGAAVNVGSSAAWTYKGAIERALLESIQSRRISRVTRQIHWPDTLPTEHDITTINKRLFYWYGKDRIADVQPWLDTDQSIEYQNLVGKDSSFQEALETMRERHYHVFAADITLPPLQKQGIEVVKVVIPELHPLFLDERAKMLYSVHHGSIPADTTLKPHFLV